MVRIVSFVLAAGAMSLAPALAQQRSPQDAAKDFSLDPAALSGDPTPSTVPTAAPPSSEATDAPPAAAAAADAPATPDAAPAVDAPIVATLGPPPSLDTPIAQLVANPRAKAVLDKDLPGLSSDENLPKFEQLSLRRFQPLTGGQLTKALLDRVGADLAALGSGAVSAFTPAVPATSPRRGRQDDGR